MRRSALFKRNANRSRRWWKTVGLKSAHSAGAIVTPSETQKGAVARPSGGLRLSE